MNKKVLIIDTSILCVWLDVPGMNKIVRKGFDDITPDVVKDYIDEQTAEGVRIVLPFAVIIECGNHITQIKGDNKHKVDEMAELVEKAIDGTEPWDVFAQQKTLFERDSLKAMISEWRVHGPSRLSIGDTSIKQVAEFYHNMGYVVEIYTGDNGLKAFQPVPKSTSPLSRNRGRR